MKQMFGGHFRIQELFSFLICNMRGVREQSLLTPVESRLNFRRRSTGEFPVAPLVLTGDGGSVIELSKLPHNSKISL